MPLIDQYHRPVKDLRISVTDRCNYRCTYCMPFDEYTWIEKDEVLSFEEITRLATLFIQTRSRKDPTDRRRAAGPPRSGEADRDACHLCPV